MIYEERRTSLRRAGLREYLAVLRRDVEPALAQEGGRVTCALSGLIGAPATDLLQITRFPDSGAWERGQSAWASRRELVEAEEVRLLRSVASRPKESLPDEDRQAVYGYRKFFISASDLDEFVRCSEEGVWPRIEAQGARILGLWRTAAATDPLEVVLLTGYRGPAHWEATRGSEPMPEGFDSDLWERSRRLGARRNELTLKSWVLLMRALELDGAPAQGGQ